MSKKLIYQGAEAKVYLENNIISKERIPKSYRHKNIDNQLRKKRTRTEVKILSKARELKINVPKILSSKGFDIQMEFINGEKISDNLNSYNKKKQLNLMKEIGRELTKLHENNIIHGDLTTSNMILKKDKIFIIDFGLGFISSKIEDKAVDLHLIKEALEAKHFLNHKNLFKEFLKNYNPKEKEKILERLKAVEKRGRYRH